MISKDINSGRPLDYAQSTLLVLAINYVNEVEKVFEEREPGQPKAMVDYAGKQGNQLSDLNQHTQLNLSRGVRMRVMACITMDAHARDIVEKWY